MNQLPLPILKKIERVKELSLPDGCLKQLLDFDKQNSVDGLSQSRRASYLSTLSDLALKTKKPYKETTKEDLIDYFAGFENKDYSSETIKVYKINVKRFFKWLLSEDDDEYPKLVKWIKTNGNGHGKQPKKKHAITPQEVKALVTVAPSLKWQVLLSLVYETACRVNEALVLSLADIQQDKYGFFVKIRQTKNRNESTIRLIDTAPYLSTYLSRERAGDDLTTPLFIAETSKQALSYITAKDALKRFAKEAKLANHITWHCFRHGRLTQLAQEGWSDREIMGISGHKTHRMIGEYVKYGDIRKKQLIEAGILDEKGAKKDATLQPIVCPVCKAENPASNKWCVCGRPLNPDAAQSLDEIQKLQAQHAVILQHQVEILEKRLAALEKSR